MEKIKLVQLCPQKSIFVSGLDKKISIYFHNLWWFLKFYFSKPEKFKVILLSYISLNIFQATS